MKPLVMVYRTYEQTDPVLITYGDNIHQFMSKLAAIIAESKQGYDAVRLTADILEWDNEAQEYRKTGKVDL